MTSEELLEFLKKDATIKVQKTLDVIFEICTEQKNRGVNDFTIATIAKLGYKRGVPKAQSIRNKTGRKYRELINFFSENNPQNINTKKISKTDEDWISEIDNPKLQLLARIQAAELKEARQTLQEIIPPSTRIVIDDYKNDNINPSLRLNPAEIKALKYLLSDEFQNKWNFNATEWGELIDSEGTPVFKAGTLDAINKALEYLS